MHTVQADHDLLMPGETARRLRTTPSTLARWARTGRIRSVELPGGRRRYRRGDVEAILASGQPTPTDAA
ncbi:HTH_17 domain-containing protein [Frankia sp. Hr75.2]|nr:HTH_17 domain-containing protein [Frankia sp. Hr75.2]